MVFNQNIKILMIWMLFISVWVVLLEAGEAGECVIVIIIV